MAFARHYRVLTGSVFSKIGRQRGHISLNRAVASIIDISVNADIINVWICSKYSKPSRTVRALIS